MKIATPVTASIPGASGHFRTGQIVDLKRGEVISFDQLIERIASKDLVFVGEVHDNPEHHLIQVQILQSLMGCCGPVTIAMEFLRKPDQEFIDLYLKGELTEEQFLEKIDWRGGGWGFAYHLYRPIFLLAKQNKSEMLPINAPHEIVKKVARKGLNSLDHAERNRLATDIDLSNKAHFAYVREVYEHHSHKQLREFEYFYEAQCVWEDTMAENIAKYLGENRVKVVALTGNGHIVNKFGIPDRVISRFPVSMVTIMPYPLNENVVIKGETADFVWLTPAYPRRVHGSSRVF
jgi:uncharacterized iron-regulated protein